MNSFELGAKTFSRLSNFGARYGRTISGLFRMWKLDKKCEVKSFRLKISFQEEMKFEHAFS